jgi:hypothetical protein
MSSSQDPSLISIPPKPLSGPIKIQLTADSPFNPAHRAQLASFAGVTGWQTVLNSLKSAVKSIQEGQSVQTAKLTEHIDSLKDSWAKLMRVAEAGGEIDPTMTRITGCDAVASVAMSYVANSFSESQPPRRGWSPWFTRTIAILTPSVGAESAWDCEEMFRTLGTLEDQYKAIWTGVESLANRLQTEGEHFEIVERIEDEERVPPYEDIALAEPAVGKSGKDCEVAATGG